MPNNISYEEEIADSLSLSSLIRGSRWVDSTTILVCCSPSYSSSLCQILNHSLSTSNNNELYEQIFFEMPPSISNQVWDPSSRSYQRYDRYTNDFANTLSPSMKYLFINSSTTTGKNFSLLNKILSPRHIERRFASLYVAHSSIFYPDYYVSHFSREDGPLTFSWENPLLKVITNGR